MGEQMGAYEKLRADYERLRLLYQVSNEIHESLDPKQALEIILKQAKDLTNANSASISLVNPTTAMLELQAAIGIPEDVAKTTNCRSERGSQGGWPSMTPLPLSTKSIRTLDTQLYGKRFDLNWRCRLMSTIRSEEC